MVFVSMNVRRIYIVRLDPGEDVLESIRSFLGQAGIRQAIVLGGYGTLAAYHVHWVAHNRIPTENLFRRGEGGNVGNSIRRFHDYGAPTCLRVIRV